VAGGASPGYRMAQDGTGLRMFELCEPQQHALEHHPPDTPLLDAWFELNYRLQEEAVDTQINKAFVEEWMMRLWAIVSPRPQCFWLFLARINELALLCASRYVDCCDFAAADGLLVEPSHLFLPVEAGRPLQEKRHAVREKRGDGTGAEQELVATGKRVMPLLASLYDLLAGSACLTEEYLLSVSRRTEKVVQVVERLVELAIYNTEDFSLRLSCMDPAQRRDFRSRLCCFDQRTFNELGRALHLFMCSWNVNDEYVRNYLRG
jgi:hypothetical protein